MLKVNHRFNKKIKAPAAKFLLQMFDTGTSQISKSLSDRQQQDSQQQERPGIK